jgi:putative restriction endonuclease
MQAHFMQQSTEWGQPLFKVLAHNDTGAAVGHQGGILIPTAMRKYFPTLSGTVSSLRPTIDQRLNVQLFVEEKFLCVVNARYQFQTWTGKRTPESRITDELGPLRNSAEGGDILIFQQSVNELDLYRLTLIRKTSAFYAEVSSRTYRRRWGELR